MFTLCQAAATALACPSLARGALLSARVKYYSCTYTRRYSSREQRSSSIFLRCPPELSMSITTWPPRAFRAPPGLRARAAAVSGPVFSTYVSYCSPGRYRISPDRSSYRRVAWLRVHHPSGICWTCPDESEACHMRTPLGVSLLSLLVGAVIDRVDGQ